MEVECEEKDGKGKTNAHHQLSDPAPAGLEEVPPAKKTCTPDAGGPPRRTWVKRDSGEAKSSGQTGSTDNADRQSAQTKATARATFGASD